MASSYTPLGVELMVTGENAGTWGTKTNTNLQIIEQITGGYSAKSIAGGVQTTALTVVDGNVTGSGQFRMIEFTGSITGAYTVQFKYATGSGSSVTFGTTDKGDKLVFATANDGTNPDIKDLAIGTTSPAGTTGQVQINSSGSFGAVAEGTSGFVLTSNGSAAAPTMQAPAVSVGKAIAMAIVFG